VARTNWHAWLLTLVLVGYVAGMTSVTGWILLAAIALTLPAVVLHFWRRPEPLMSESIRDVLR
jgi:hypothetical protein